MKSPTDAYFDAANDLLQKARESNAETLRTAGALIGQSIADGGVLHTFGSGHSEIIGREIIGRAGGLMPVSGIFDPGAGFRKTSSVTAPASPSATITSTNSAPVK